MTLVQRLEKVCAELSINMVRTPNIGSSTRYTLSLYTPKGWRIRVKDVDDSHPIDEMIKVICDGFWDDTFGQYLFGSGYTDNIPFSLLYQVLFSLS